MICAHTQKQSNFVLAREGGGASGGEGGSRPRMPCRCKKSRCPHTGLLPTMCARTIVFTFRSPFLPPLLPQPFCFYSLKRSPLSLLLYPNCLVRGDWCSKTQQQNPQTIITGACDSTACASAYIHTYMHTYRVQVPATVLRVLPRWCPMRGQRRQRGMCARACV